MPLTIRLLDYRMTENGPVLLDGKGGLLPQDSEPVWLEVASADMFPTNSAGEVFNPSCLRSNDGASEKPESLQWRDIQLFRLLMDRRQ